MTGAGGQAARFSEAQIEEARKAQSLVALVARRVRLRRAGRGWSGLCPFHQEKTPSFTVSDEKGFYHCFGCGAHGDAIRWMMEAEGLGFVEAVRDLLGGQLPDARRELSVPQREAAVGRRHDVVDSATAGRWIYRTSGPAKGEIVERWLAARGLDPAAEFIPGCPAIDQLRFHPRCPASAWRVDEEPEQARLSAPAMVAPIRDAAGAVWGVHVTYLAPDGRSKARFPLLRDGKERPTRKMFGAVAGNAVALSGPTIGSTCPPDRPLPIVVGEGIETTWSFAQQLGEPCAAFATLSLENLQGRIARLKDGSVPLWNLRAAEGGAGFTIDGAERVIVLVDADMKPLRDQKVQLAKGAPPVRSDISGLQRAQICATIATQHWRRAGASSVDAVRPPMGMDFNDAVRSAA